MRKSFFLLLPLSIFLSLPSHALASLAPTTASSQTVNTTTLVSCPPIYNGGSTCEQNKDFSVDKKILNPHTGTYVDSIDPQELKIQTDHTAMFRIQITNLTKGTLNNITVTDTLPSYMQFVNASNQITSSTDTNVTYTIPALASGKTNMLMIETKVTSPSSLPQNIVCLANQAEAKQANKRASDIVSFCIERLVSSPVSTTTKQTTSTTQSFVPGTTKGGLPIYPEPQSNKAPNTGPEALALISLLPLAFAGFKLRSINLS